jgi:hypothetical protein
MPKKQQWWRVRFDRELCGEILLPIFRKWLKDCVWILHTKRGNFCITVCHPADELYKPERTLQFDLEKAITGQIRSVSWIAADEREGRVMVASLRRAADLIERELERVKEDA